VRLQHAVHGGPGVAYRIRGRIIRIVRKDVEEVATDDLVAAREGGLQVGIAGGEDVKAGVENQIEAGDLLEDRPEVGGGGRLSRSCFTLRTLLGPLDGLPQAVHDLRRSGAALDFFLQQIEEGVKVFACECPFLISHDLLRLLRVHQFRQDFPRAWPLRTSVPLPAASDRGWGSLSSPGRSERVSPT
jgi:hypothetical protein